MMPLILLMFAMVTPLGWIRTSNFTRSEEETGEKVKGGKVCQETLRNA